jgi:glycolate dehydrogenase FAD-binding subunit
LTLAVDGLVPARISRPSDVGDVSRVVSEADARGEGVVAAGRGRHLDMGATPDRCDVMVQLDRLDRVLAHEPADMTVTVEAGCTLAALEQTLSGSGQWLPTDPPCPDETTVGGLIAANLSGPLRASQGTVRDLLLGVTVVGARGVILRGGGRVVKNVAGYDLPKVHVGALGTLGIIVEATFKVRPRFPREEALVVEVPTLAAACELALALRDAIEPTWLEVVHPASLLAPDLAGSCVAIGMGGAPAWIGEATAAASLLARGARRHAEGAALRQRLAELLVRPAAAIVRVSTLVTEIGSFVAPAVAALEERGVKLDVTAHAANGVARLAIARPDAVAQVVDHLRAAAPAGAVVVVERATPVAKAGIDVWGRVGSGAPLMMGLKHALDPGGVFAPGRFVEGS